MVDASSFYEADRRKQEDKGMEGKDKTGQELHRESSGNTEVK